MLAHEPHRRVRQGRRVRHLLLNSRWVMSGSNLTEYRHPYYTKQWAVLRREALTRDGYQCQRCRVILTNGRRSPLSAVVHHIQAHKGDGELFHDLANLQAVCWQKLFQRNPKPVVCKNFIAFTELTHDIAS